MKVVDLNGEIHFYFDPYRKQNSSLNRVSYEMAARDVSVNSPESDWWHFFTLESIFIEVVIATLTDDYVVVGFPVHRVNSSISYSSTRK
jgi:hypothetical protein